MDGQVQLLESVFQSGSCWLECRSDGWSAEDILDHILRILNEIEGASVFDNHGTSVPDLIGTQAGSIVRHKAWCAGIHGVAKSWTRLSDWTELN